MTKDDAQKPSFSLVPQVALLAVARIMTFGAAKYGRLNWKQPDDHPVPRPSRLLDAAQRHINAHLRGEAIDADSGEPHLAHAAASIMMALELEAESC